MVRKELVWMDRKKLLVAAALFLGALFCGFLLAEKSLFLLSSNQKLDNEFLACMTLPQILQTVQCVGAHASGWLATYGLPQVSAELDAYENRFGADTVCHLAGHQIGQAALAEKGDLFQTLAQCTEGCYSSCVHGALIGYTASTSISQLLARDPEKLCASQDVQADGGYRLCIHGLGHAFMIGEDYDIGAAVRDCDRLGSRALTRSECYSGVYMELSNASFGLAERAVPESIYYKEGDSFYPCDSPPTSLNDAYARQCYQQKVAVLMHDARLQKKSMFDVCATAPARWRNACVVGIGLVQAARNPDFSHIRDICGGSDDPQLQRLCLSGAYGYIAVGKNALQATKEFCAKLTPDEKAICDVPTPVR